MTRKKYYHKKKYKRKRGPKKKKNYPKFPYQIIITRNGVQKERIKNYKTIKDAYIDFHNLISENDKNITFHQKYINYGKIYEIKDEILIIKKRDENDENFTILRNDLGQFSQFVAKQKSDNVDENQLIYGKQNEGKSWIIIDKHPWKYEETFWCFGFHPKYERKDFNFIYNNFILEHTKEYGVILRVLIYLNKIIFDFGNDMNIVFCKNTEDAERLYMTLMNKANTIKLKNVLWCGRIRDKQTVIYWLDKLEEKTNFNRTKLKRNSLRP